MCPTESTELSPPALYTLNGYRGHKNFESNERADQAAKAAVISTTTKMKSAQNRSIQSMAKTKWETEWKTGRETARQLRNISQ
jgi:hypothetical protein